MRDGEDRIVTSVRNFYDEQIRRLGYLRPARRTIRFAGGGPYYDIRRVRGRRPPTTWAR